MNVNVLLLQLDGKLPNIALCRIAAHHRDHGDAVTLQQARTPRSVDRCPWETWDRVYASSIFTKSQPIAERLRVAFPDVIVGGTGIDLEKPASERMTLERVGITTRRQDYSLYPAFQDSIGYTQRGCRLNCTFCDVPKSEGKVKAEQTIRELWRGEPYPRHLLLLDNDFFGQPGWRDLVAEIRDGKFKVCFTQGINARMLNDEAAGALASMDYRNSSFKVRRLYTAWDNLSDEGPLLRGLQALVRHGVQPDHIMVYMLVGYQESLEDRLYRHARLRDFGARPYPMPYRRTPELIGFQRWAVRRIDRFVSWQEFQAAGYRPERFGPSPPEPLFV